jgi:hypothetical protein
MNPKLAIYTTICVMAFIRLAFAGLLYIAAVDSKTMLISYILITISSVIIVLSIRKLFRTLTILKKVIVINE